MLAPVWGSILCTGLGDLPIAACVPPRGGVNARMGFPISMAGLVWTARREAQRVRRGSSSNSNNLCVRCFPRLVTDTFFTLIYLLSFYTRDYQHVARGHQVERPKTTWVTRRPVLKIALLKSKVQFYPLTKQRHWQLIHMISNHLSSNRGEHLMT